MANSVKANVTQALVDRATKRDSRHCMIAEAIQAARPDYKNVTVDLATIRWTNPRTGKRYVALTPQEARVALVAFDQGHEVQAFELTVTPIQATPTSKPTGERAANGRLKRSQAGRGQQQLTERGTIVGGEPLPEGHLRGGANVTSANAAAKRERERPQPTGDESNVELSSRRYRQYGLAQLKG